MNKNRRSLRLHMMKIGYPPTGYWSPDMEKTLLDDLQGWLERRGITSLVSMEDAVDGRTIIVCYLAEEPVSLESLADWAVPASIAGEYDWHGHRELYMQGQFLRIVPAT